MPYTLFLVLLFAPLIVVTAEDSGQASDSGTYQAAVTDTLPALIYDASEPFTNIETANLEGLLSRIGDARIVLLGEASHGTREFYEMRARITRELIENKGFNIVAVEGDWPDASTIDYYIRGSGQAPDINTRLGPMYKNRPFSVFPQWMWRNHSVVTFTRWLKDYNHTVDSADAAVGFYGLDLYNLYGSIELVLDYLVEVNPKLAEFAHWSYGCLGPWADDPSGYSRSMLSDRKRSCEDDLFVVVEEFNRNRDFYQQLDKQRFFHAEQNLRLIKNGEQYFRTMHGNSHEVWNRRDNNMFDTLQAVLDHRGENSKAVVWAHNIHIGDARATDMKEDGEINLGQRVREAFGDDAYLIGFGTDHGTVSAAPGWDRPVQRMHIPPAHPESYEYLFHQVKADNFLLPLREPVQASIRKELMADRLERAIGVAYDPDNELKKHYYSGSLPHQFDEYIWFDETHAVEPLRY